MEDVLTDVDGYYVLDFNSFPKLEDFAGHLLDGRLWFGKYPTPEELETIKKNKFTHIVNLCTSEEITWTPYLPPSSLHYIAYPFEDGQKQRPQTENGDISQWTSFPPFIKSLVKILGMKQNKVYIHCKGGHGRSPTVCAIIYGLIKKVDALKAMKIIRAAHQERKVMDPKWRKLGAPQRAKQKKIVCNFLGMESSCQTILGV